MNPKTRQARLLIQNPIAQFNLVNLQHLGLACAVVVSPGNCPAVKVFIAFSKVVDIVAAVAEYFKLYFAFYRSGALLFQSIKRAPCLSGGASNHSFTSSFSDIFSPKPFSRKGLCASVVLGR